jgi:hypothetical protein
LDRGYLEQLLTQFKSQHNATLDEVGPPLPARNLAAEAGARAPYGFIPMPVDYETYCRWMAQFGHQDMAEGV